MNKKIYAVSICLSFFLLSTNVFTDKTFSKRLSEKEIQEFSNSDDLDELTVKVASLIMSSDGSELPKEEAVISAETRQLKLSELMEKNPAEVLRYAFPEEILKRSPQEIKPYLEQREEIKGELEIISECEENDGKIVYYLNTDKEKISLHFAKQSEEELLTGLRVKVKGIRLGDAVAVGENDLQKETDQQAVQSILPNTFGERKTLILLVNFRNDTREPYTAAQVTNTMATVSNYLRDVSYQQTWTASDIYGWFTLPINSGDCTGTQTASAAKQAAANAGINVNGYNHIIYAYPQMTSCNYGGRGTIGGNEVWINGNFGSYIASHELGHNFGLYHARAKDCGSEIIGNNCATIEYGNTVNTMGATVIGHYHSYQKERLGWLNYGISPPVTTVQTSGNYFISPMSVFDSGSKALKILKSSGTYYYVEIRRQIGFDSSIASANTNGVIITTNSESNGQENYLLDMTPATSSWNDAALAVNRSYIDSSAGVTITPLSVDNGGALVNITLGNTPPPQPTCTMNNPTISVNPSATQWIGAGGSFSLSVTVKNNNSSSCASNNFNIQPMLPNGWSAVVSPPVLSISPGASVAATVQITAPSGTADGFYSIGTSAGNYSSPNYSASASVNCAIYSSLGVNASPSQKSYTRTQSAKVTAYISANGSPMSGANVTFIMTKANGSRVTATAVSGGDGSAVFSYKFNKKQDPTGTYYVSVNGNLNGVSGNGSTSFEAR